MFRLNMLTMKRNYNELNSNKTIAEQINLLVFPKNSI